MLCNDKFQNFYMCEQTLALFAECEWKIWEMRAGRISCRNTPLLYYCPSTIEIDRKLDLLQQTTRLNDSPDVFNGLSGGKIKSRKIR